MEGGFLGLLQARFLNNKSHIFFGWKIDTFALPQRVVDGEGIDGHSQVFGMDLGETLSSGVVFEEPVKHSIIDLLWPCPIQLVNFFSFWIEGIDGSELAPSISKQDEEMLGLRASYLLQDTMFGCLVYHAREDTVLHCIKNYGPV